MKKILLILVALFLASYHWLGDRQSFQETTQGQRSSTIVQVENFNSKGEKVVLNYHQGPKKIIAIWQNSIENVLALGEGDKLVAALGVPDPRHIKEEYREQYRNLAKRSQGKVDTQYIMDVESALVLEPELIVGWYSTFGPKVLRSTDFWHKRGVDTYIAPSSTPGSHGRVLANEINDILNLGKILGKEKKAQEIVNNMEQEINFVVEKTKAYPKKTRGVILGKRGKDLYLSNRKSLAGDIFLKVNGELLDPEERTMSMERLIELNPDVIFALVGENSYDNPESVVNGFLNDTSLRTVKAIREKRVIPIPFYAAYSAGVRSLDGIQLMARGLYPELYRDEKGIGKPL